MLTPSAAFKNHMSRAGVQPVYMIEIHLSVSDVRYFSTASVNLSDLAGIAVYPSVSDVVGVASSIDIESRAVSIGEFHVIFLDDTVLRDLIKAEFIYGKKVIVKLGCTDLVRYAAYLPVAVGVTRDIIPSEGEFDLEVADMLEMLKNKTVGPRYWLNSHPLEVIEDILKASKIGASLYDAATLSPTADLTRSHFLVSRFDARTYGLDEPIVTNGVNDAGESAKDLIDELCELLWGSFAPDELGVYKYKTYDPTKAVDRDLGENDFAPVEQLSSADPLYNVITMNASKQTRYAGESAPGNPYLGKLGPKATKDVSIGFTQSDATSIASHNFLGNSSTENEVEISTNWMCGPSRIGLALKVIGGTLTRENQIARPGVGLNEKASEVLYDIDAINLMDAAYNGFCGCKFDLGTIPAASRNAGQQQYPHTFPVKTNRNVSASRPSYLLIEGLAHKFVRFATVKTQPTITDTVIELENIDASNYVVGMVLTFGSDAGTGNAGYAVVSFDSVNGTVTLATGIQTAAPVGEYVYSIDTSATIPRTRLEQWQTEIVKVVDIEAYTFPATGATAHDELKRWPGGDGCLGPWDTSTQRLPRSSDIATTAIGVNPTVAVDGRNYTWPYLTLYNNRYPRVCRFRFEGTSGVVGTSPFGHPSIGSAASGRGQFGTEIPYAWKFIMSAIGDSATEDQYQDGADGLYYAKAWDITILVDNVNRRIERFKNGCPRLKIKTTLDHADLQLGDFVTIVSDVYSAYGRSEADDDVVFEVISKTIDALADDPGCEFELAWVRDDAVVYPASAYNYEAFTAQRGFTVSPNTTVYSTNTAGIIEPVLTTAGIEIKTDSGS